MTTFEINPISVNAAWRGGQRFRTKEYLAFEEEAILLMRLSLTKTDSQHLLVRITFFHPNPTKFDVDNYAKPVLDCLVKAGVILDDRFVFSLMLKKEQAEKQAFGVEIGTLI